MGTATSSYDEASGDGAATPAGEPAPTDRWTPPQLLRDDPAEADEFGGGHERLARALAGLVADEEGRRAVALSGPFGSGKSTVIQLLQRRIQAREDKRDVQVFSFDAWAHRGDPLRRSFIEELVAFLRAHGWVQPGEWERELERLSRRREETDTTSGPRLTSEGVAAAVAVLLLPLGFALLTEAFRRADIFGGVGFFGVVLVLLPFLIALSAYLARRPWGEWREHTVASFLNPRLGNDGAAESLFSLLVREKHTETHTTTIRTPDPTTVEFRDVFRRITGDALDEEGRVLILVVDNLDRLTSVEEAVNAWSAMRTFFDRGPASGAAWEKRLWLVVPFDTEALGRVWPQEAERERGLEEFLAKTFGVVLRVPPPVLSEWREFFLGRLNRAFPYWAESRSDEIHSVFRLYQLERVAGRRPPTPRQIKAFINRLAALDRQWQGALPLRTLALYLLKEDEIGLAAGELSNEEFLTPATRGTVGADWQRQLAAVHFNVEPEKSLQILVGGDVAAAFASGDGSALDGLADVAGLDEVVLEAIRSVAYEGSPDEVALAARALATADIGGGPSIRSAWDTLIRQAGPSEEVKQISRPVGEGLAALIRLASSHGYTAEAERLASRAVGALARETVGEMGSILTQQWVGAATPVIREINRSGLEKALSGLTVQAPPTAYIEVLSALSEQHDAEVLARYLQPSAGPSEILDALTATVQAGEFRVEHLEAVRLLQRVRDGKGKAIEWTWPPLSSAIQTRLSPPFSADMEIDEVAPLVDYLQSRRGAKDVEDIRGVLVTDGTLYHYAAAFPSEHALAATLVLSVLKTDPAVSAPAASGKASKGHTMMRSAFDSPTEHPDLVEAVAERVTSLWAWDLLKIAKEHPNTRSLVGRVIQRVMDRDDVLDILTVEDLRHADTLMSALDEGFDDLVRAHVGRGDFVERLDDVVGLPHLRFVLHHTLRRVTDDGDWEEYRSYLVTRLGATGAATWLEHLNEENDVVRIVGDLASDEEGLSLEAELADGLRQYALSLSGDNPHVPTDPQAVEKVIDALSPNYRDTLLRNLRDDAITAGNLYLGPVIPVFGTALATDGKWEEKADDVVRGLFANVIREGDQLTLRWLSDSFAANPDTLKRAKRPSRIALLDLIEKRERSGETLPEARRVLEDLARQLKQRVRREKGTLDKATDFLFGDDEG